ncbi:hypothetical protein [Microbulbifer sp. PSTR4-B]|uniref:hypothetical protein n=1 Tax=Microbulbifer sp. PSTR4-B TaxID=3243396 RepID=UPI00403A2718
MQTSPTNQTFSLGVIESELNRLGERPVADFLEGLRNGIDERIAQTQHCETSKQYPCPVCHGAGWLILSGDIFAFSPNDKLLKPIQRTSGKNIRAGVSLECPRCLGLQYDLKALVDAWRAQALEVAA